MGYVTDCENKCHRSGLRKNYPSPMRLVVAAPRDVRNGHCFEQAATLAALKSRKRMHTDRLAHGLRADPAVPVAAVT